MTRRVALVTGASKGIGAATARILAAEGCAVAVNYNRSKAEAEALAAEIRDNGGTAIAVQADVSDGAAAAKMVDNVLEKFCQLDILVCNAGVTWQGLLHEMTAEEWRKVFAVDVDGVFHCCHAALPHMIHRKTGRIITVSSMWGVTGGACEVAYSAAKAAVIGFSKALAKEVGPSGITVNCVAPGVIATDMNSRLTEADLAALREETPLERIGTPEEVAQSIAFLASDAGSFYTGQVLQPNGGIVI
ncbi:MAG: 3-oxoacyl-ACP reductase FabG [Oscillospiraceae bacterium]|nr:3-oxoacyl-ACP reductase FabG [Oscillospiraceae bacterium]